MDTQTREEVIEAMQRNVDLMAAHIQDMREGKTGQGFAWMAPDRYRDLVAELARIDGTNGYGREDQ